MILVEVTAVGRCAGSGATAHRGGGGGWTFGTYYEMSRCSGGQPYLFAKSVRKMTQMPKKSDLNLKARGLGTHGDAAFRPLFLRRKVFF